MLCNEEMRKSILSRLQGYRYEHSLGVERAAIMLAEKYGEDPEKAGISFFLWDWAVRIARGLSYCSTSTAVCNIVILHNLQLEKAF